MGNLGTSEKDEHSTSAFTDMVLQLLLGRAGYGASLDGMVYFNILKPKYLLSSFTSGPIHMIAVTLAHCPIKPSLGPPIRSPRQ